MGDVVCDEVNLETVPMSRHLSSTSVRNVDIRPHDMWLIKFLGLTASNEITLEIDNHADTCVVGKQALIIYDYERPVSVQATQQLSLFSFFTAKHPHPVLNGTR